MGSVCKTIWSGVRSKRGIFGCLVFSTGGFYVRNIIQNLILFCTVLNRNTIKYNQQTTNTRSNTPITVWIYSANHLVGWVSNPSSTNQKPSTHPAPTDSCQKQLSQRYTLHILDTLTKRRIHAMLVHCSGCAVRKQPTLLEIITPISVDMHLSSATPAWPRCFDANDVIICFADKNRDHRRVKKHTSTCYLAETPSSGANWETFTFITDMNLAR